MALAPARLTKKYVLRQLKSKYLLYVRNTILKTEGATSTIRGIFYKIFLPQ